MRKIRNTALSTNPLGMFAIGVEQIVREQIIRPTDYKDYELNAMARKEQSEIKSDPKSLIKNGFHAVDILKMLTWTKAERNS